MNAPLSLVAAAVAVILHHGTRPQLADAAQRLIDRLDVIDEDPDAEADRDGEPDADDEASCKAGVAS